MKNISAFKKDPVEIILMFLMLYNKSLVRRSSVFLLKT